MDFTKHQLAMDIVKSLNFIDPFYSISTTKHI